MKQLKQLLSTLIIGTLIALLAACSGPSNMGGGVSSSSTSSFGQPENIALLLPLQGSLAGPAAAIRDGFFSAYYISKQGGNAPKVNIYDTSQGDVVSLYQQAIANGANVVVGPLTKGDVQTLAASGKISVPTLALNTINTSNGIFKNRSLFQFSLSPQDEAFQAADRAKQDGHSRIITIYPQGEWGQNVVAAFNQEWQQQGGQIVDSLAYSPRSNLSASLAQLLQVNSDAAKNSRITTQQLAATQLHRTDFDAIFLVATPEIARQIKPLLAFYYAGNIPVYATASVYSGTPNTRLDRDLDGIRFDDMPFVLSDNPSVAAAKQQAAQLGSNSYRQFPKFYAMGMDAFNIITHINNLGSSPQNGLYGMTGILYVGSDQIIHRQLLWAEFRGGYPMLIS